MVYAKVWVKEVKASAVTHRPNALLSQTMAVEYKENELQVNALFAFQHAEKSLRFLSSGRFEPEY